jgi:hypothetical protein
MRHDVVDSRDDAGVAGASDGVLVDVGAVVPDGVPAALADGVGALEDAAHALRSIAVASTATNRSSENQRMVDMCIGDGRPVGGMSALYLPAATVRLRSDR